MGRRMRSEEGRIRDIIRVAGRSSGVIWRNEKVVETLLTGHYWIFRIEDFVVGPSAAGKQGKVFLDFGTDDPDRMCRTKVQVSPN